MQKRFETDFAGKKLIIETGLLAQQANGSCTVQYGDTVVMATATMGGVREGVNWFPLSVEYEERLYAVGKIKGSRWIKREGRPTDEAVLSARLIDRSIRPLFSKDIKNEVQIIMTVLSYDQENDSDIPGMIAASTALAISDIPWAGPLAGVRLGLIDGEFQVNPTIEAREKATLELIVAGKQDKILMIEAEGQEATEEDVYKGFEIANQHLGPMVEFIAGIAKEIGKEKAVLEAPSEESEEEESSTALAEAMQKAQVWLNENVAKIIFDKPLTVKHERKGAVQKCKDDLDAYLEAEGIGKERRKKAAMLVDPHFEKVVSQSIITDEKRVDGRSLTQIRELSAHVNLLPRTHGSALFNRGETQVLSIVTLGSPGDEQMLDGMEEAGTKRFMHHYNFPPYSVGETGRVGGPGRREIGHGALAEKGIRPMMPSQEEFPYTIRVVSEVLGSNGSSSMGSTCGTSLALMDAGVPIKKAVAGIAMGLASDGEGNYKVLTDLQDLEDGKGGMDFKIAGTQDGITAIQLDTKTDGLSLQICKETLSQGKDARLEILGVMNKAISEPRAEMSQYAPRISVIHIKPDQIRDVIGPGGKVINEIIEKTGVQMDIEQDGTVMITSTDQAGAQKAIEWVENLTKEVQPGETYEGKVTRIMEFGAIVEFLPGKDGMVHVSEISHQRVGKVEDVLKVGDVVKVKVLKVEDNGRIGLSMKALLPRPEGMPERTERPHGDRKPRDRKPFFKKDRN